MPMKLSGRYTMPLIALGLGTFGLSLLLPSYSQNPASAPSSPDNSDNSARDSTPALEARIATPDNHAIDELWNNSADPWGESMTPFDLVDYLAERNIKADFISMLIDSAEGAQQLGERAYDPGDYYKGIEVRYYPGNGKAASQLGLWMADHIAGGDEMMKDLITNPPTVIMELVNGKGDAIGYAAHWVESNKNAGNGQPSFTYAPTDNGRDYNFLFVDSHQQPNKIALTVPELNIISLTSCVPGVPFFNIKQRITNIHRTTDDGAGILHTALYDPNGGQYTQNIYRPDGTINQRVEFNQSSYGKSTTTTSFYPDGVTPMTKTENSMVRSSNPRTPPQPSIITTHYDQHGNVYDSNRYSLTSTVSVYVDNNGKEKADLNRGFNEAETARRQWIRDNSPETLQTGSDLIAKMWPQMVFSAPRQRPGR